MAGSFVWTLVLRDIASRWTECVPLLVREAGVVVDAVDRLRGALPFPLRGIDTDNGSEFLNEVLIGFLQGVVDDESKGAFRRATTRVPRKALLAHATTVGARTNTVSLWPRFNLQDPPDYTASGDGSDTLTAALRSRLPSESLREIRRHRPSKLVY